MLPKATLVVNLVFAASLLMPGPVPSGSSTAAELRVVSDATVKYSKNLESGWETIGFDDSAWSTAVAPSAGLCNPSQGGYLEDSTAVPVWVDDPLASNETAYFRKVFSVQNAGMATIRTYVDDDLDLYINGALIRSDSDGMVSQFVDDVSASIRSGINVVAIKARNVTAACGWLTFDLTVSVQPGLGPNIVANGSFETPDVTSITLDTYYAGQSFGGWAVESGQIDHISERYWQAADGRQSVDLDGTCGAGAVYQELLTSPLQPYLLRFSLAGNPEGPPSIKQMEVWWGTTLVDTLAFDTSGHSKWSMGWSFHQYTITATSAITRLTFKSLTPGCFGPVLDMVSAQSYNGVVPLLDLPLDYTTSGRRFSDVALGHNVGGWVNSWFDHKTPDYKEDQELHLWNGTVLTDSAMINVGNCSSPPGAFGLSCYDGHNGIDYQRQSDDTVYAAAPGIVVDLCDSFPCARPKGEITSDPSYGKWVLIRHGEPGNYGRYATFYAHLDEIDPNLAIGTEITDIDGTPIGRVGGTGGHSPHLHFGLYYDADGDNQWEETYQGYTEAVDPYGWFGTSADPWWNTSLYLWSLPLWDTMTGNEYGAILTTPSGKGKLTILPGELSGPITLELWDAPMPTATSDDLRAIGHTIWLRVLEWLNGPTGVLSGNSVNATTGFPQPVSINIRYGTDETQHLDTSRIGVYMLDETGSSWVALATTVDHSLMEANAEIIDMGIFSLQAPLICPDDDSEPNDTYDAASALTPNGGPHGQLLDIQQDEDWFRLEAVPGFWYTIQTSDLSTGVDTVLELYDQDGTTELAEDDNSGGDLASQLLWEAPLSGTYFVRVSQAAGSASGCDASYKLTAVRHLQTYLPLIQR